MSSMQEKVEFLEGRISMVRGWLASHGEGTKHPWPQHDIDAKRQALDMFKEIRDDYANAIDRRRAG